MLVGYVRVSKGDFSQTVDPQKDALIAAGVLPERIYEDFASGKQEKRAGLEECLKALRTGDTLMVWKLDRLGRSMAHIIRTIYDLNARGVGFKVITGDMDTTTATGRMVLGILASFAEFERNLIVERTNAGLAAARARGRFGGRKPSLSRTQVRCAMASMGQPGIIVADLAREFEVHTTTLYSYVGANGKLTPKGMKFMEGRK